MRWIESNKDVLQSPNDDVIRQKIVIEMNKKVNIVA